MACHLPKMIKLTIWGQNYMVISICAQKPSLECFFSSFKLDRTAESWIILMIIAQQKSLAIVEKQIFRHDGHPSGGSDCGMMRSELVVRSTNGEFSIILNFQAQTVVPPNSQQSWWTNAKKNYRSFEWSIKSERFYIIKSINFCMKPNLIFFSAVLSLLNNGSESGFSFFHMASALDSSWVPDMILT